MNLVQHVGRGAARIVGNLPCVVTGWANFEQQAHVFPKRQELANTPVKREIIARRQVEIFLLTARFVSQRCHNCCGFVSHRIPRDRALELVGPKAVAEIVSVFDCTGANDWQRHSAGVVIADRRIEAVRKRQVKMRE